uniref:Uncharacterized protein n=1 Tax=Steinernema glaseri TaxID=37863 RepID=A0A1I8AGE9_9BILA
MPRGTLALTCHHQTPPLSLGVRKTALQRSSDLKSTSPQRKHQQTGNWELFCESSFLGTDYLAGADGQNALNRGTNNACGASTSHEDEKDDSEAL